MPEPQSNFLNWSPTSQTPQEPLPPQETTPKTDVIDKSGPQSNFLNWNSFSQTPQEPPPKTEKRIDVVDKDGVFGTIPESQVENAIFKDKALRFAPKSPIEISDISPEGRVNVVNSDGTAGTIPKEELEGALTSKSKGGGGFLLKSQYDLYHSSNVQKNIDLIRKVGSFSDIPDASGKKRHPSAFAPDTGADENDPEEQAKRELGKINDGISSSRDKDGNFLMVKDGHKIPVPVDEIQNARSAGYKFENQKFEDFYNASVYLQKYENQTKGALAHGTVAAGGEVPIFGTVGKWLERGGLKYKESGVNDFEIAHSLAFEAPEVKDEFEKAEKIGAGVGIAATLLTPEGLLGEVALAGKASKALKGAEFLVNHPKLASVAAHAVEGATIAAPQIADQLIQGNPKKAAEALAIGSLGGVVLGETAGVFKSAAKVIGEKITERATNKGLSSIGAGEEILKGTQEVKSKLLDTLTESGLSKASKADDTLKVLNEVSGGSKMSSLSKLDQVGEKVNVSSLKEELNGLIKGPIENIPIKGKLNTPEQWFAAKAAARAETISPDLEKALESLNAKLEKLAPDGEITLQKLQELSSDLSSGISRIDAKSELNNFNIAARDLVMNEIYKVADQAVLKADVKTAALYAEQKGIAQATTELQNGFSALIADAEKTLGKTPSKSMVDQMIDKGIKYVFEGGGATLGHSILPFGGGWVGAKIGADIGEKAAPLAKEFIQNNIVDKLPASAREFIGNPKEFLSNLLPDSLGKNWLVKNADNPNISSYLAINALHHNNLKLGEIPNLLKNISTKTATSDFSDNPIKDMLGSSSTGLSKAQQFDRFSSKVAMLAGNDQLRDQYVDSIATTMAGNHPELKDQLKAELTNKIMVTNKLLHEDNTKDPQPFQKPEKYQPTKEKMAEINLCLNAINNPYSVLSPLKTGEPVNQKAVQLAKETHPAIFQEMVNQINQEAFSGKTEVSYQDRLALSKITGQPMDQSLKLGHQLQATYAPSDGQGSLTPQQAPKKGRSSGNSKSLHASKFASFTKAQRISTI